MDIILAQSLLEPNVGLIFYKVLVFALLLFVLGKFAWKPIVSALSEREETIDASIRKAEHALEEARKTGKKNEEARRAAEENARRVMQDARAAAERVRTDELEKTRTRIRQMQEQAQAEIEREKQRALDELRDEVAGLAIHTAEQILEETLDSPRQRKLVDRFIEQLPENCPAPRMSRSVLMPLSGNHAFLLPTLEAKGLWDTPIKTSSLSTLLSHVHDVMIPSLNTADSEHCCIVVTGPNQRIPLW